MPTPTHSEGSIDTLIASRLPGWLVQASAARLVELHDCLREQQAVQQRLKALFGSLVQAYPAAQLVDGSAAQLQRWRNQVVGAARPIEAAGCPRQRFAHDGQGLCPALPFAGYRWAVPGIS
ncbi:hypothetical protein D3C78_1514620 [compost metagenome]